MCRKRILIVGDSMLDVYIEGDVNRISPEAPVPVVLKNKENAVVGGAANVSVNVSTSGNKAILLTLIGNDNAGNILLKKLENFDVETKFLLKCTDRPTIRKTRIVATGGHQLLRLDEEKVRDISNDEEQMLLGLLGKAIYDGVDLVIISDYMKGMMTESFTKKLISRCNEQNITVIVDVKDDNYFKYSGACLIKPNRKELEKLAKIPVKTIEDVGRASKKILKSINVQYVLTTLGNEGMVLTSQESMVVFPAVSVEVFDVTGAGDTAIAYLGSLLSQGIEMKECVRYSNFAASIQVTKLGTSVVSINEVHALYFSERFKKKNINKLIGKEELNELRRINKNKKIVFTNGCFDILHVGHLKYLQKAADLGDILVVGINSDVSINRLKGKDRPINTLQDRIEMLIAYPFVDYVIPFEEDTPIELIKLIHPDYLVKGADYKRKKDVVGWDFVESNGGEVVLIDFEDGKSTTDIINTIRKGKG